MPQRFSIGVIVGAIVGLAAGLLTAPKSGKQLRGTIKKSANNVNNKLTTKKRSIVKNSVNKVSKETQK